MYRDNKMAARKRASAKIWLARAVSLLDALIIEGENCEVVELEETIQEFSKSLDALDDAQAAHEAEVEEDKLEEDITAAGELREAAIKKRHAASKLLRSLMPADPANEPDEAGSEKSGQSNRSSSSNVDTSSVRLPKLELPKFNGTLTKWQQFWDNFEAVVDTSDLPLVSKFTYLQSLLEGEARRTIEGLALSKSNYITACQLLKDRYGRRERIVFAHIQGLLNMGTLGQERSASTSELRKLQEELLAHIRSLEVWEIMGKNYGVVLTPVILSRLPSDIRLEWARSGEGKEDDLDFLLQFLKQEIERRERSEAFKQLSAGHRSSNNNNSKSNSGNRSHVDREEKRQNSVRTPTASALHVSSVGGACGFCAQNHTTEACPDLSKLDIPGKQKKIADARLCFRCLVRGHVARGCMAKCAKCNGTHHLICCYGGTKRNNNTPSTPTGSTDTYSRENADTKVALLCHDQGLQLCTVLQTAKVFVYGERIIEATLLFDSGSELSYVTSDLVKRARLRHVSNVNVGYAPFGGGKSGNQMRNVLELKAKGAYGGNETPRVFKAIEVPTICSPLSRPTLPCDMLDLLPNVTFADNYSMGGKLVIDILVGLDQYWRLIKHGTIRIAEGVVAQETEFGWILSGCYSSSNKGRAETFQLLSLGDISEEVIRSFWDLESIGISPKESVSEVDKCVTNFERDITWSHGRYEVTLPWKDQRPILLENESLARKRLSSLSRRLDKDPPLKLRYNQVLHDLETTGIIEEVKGDESPSGDVFYLPHHPVVKEASTTTKVRPVFDASAQGFNGVSLNDCLDPGPSLIPCLPEVLLRFRRWAYALTADIEKAFLQIGLRLQDRDVHRFLWENCGAVRKMRFV